MSEITTVDVPKHLVLGMRKRGQYKDIAQMIKDVLEYAEEHSIEIIGSPIFVCHELTEQDALEADQKGNAHLEVALPIAYKVVEKENIHCYELRGGKMAKIVHKGPYHESTSAYKELFAWIKDNDHAIKGPLREVYLNDPRKTKEEDILTEIYAPIE